MSDTANPYSPPRSNVHLPEESISQSQLLAVPRAVPASFGLSWIIQGWPLIKPDLGMWILMLLTLVGLFILSTFLPLIGGVTATLLGPVFVGGILMALRVADQGQKVEYSTLFTGFSTKFGSLLGLGALNLVMWLILISILGVIFWGLLALYGLGVVVGNVQPRFSATSISLVLLFGCVAFVVMTMFLWFSTPLVALNDVPVFKALGMSMKACLNNIIPLLIYSLVVMCLVIVGVAPLLLGLLIVLPLLLGSFYRSYQQIFLK